MIAAIPFDKIKKIGVYLNSGKKTMAQIKIATGADYVLNGTLFNMTAFTPANWLVVNGNTLSQLGNPFGYAMSDDKITFCYANQAGGTDFVGSYPLLIRNGKIDSEGVPAGLGGKRARSAMGLTKDSVVLFCAPESEGLTLSALASKMLAIGCENAINFDGGASSQCDFRGLRVTSSRIVLDYVCIWLKEEKQTGGKFLNAICTKKTSTLTAQGKTEIGRYIAKGDKCVINGVINDKLLIEISYPTSAGMRKAYIKSLENFTQA